MGLSWGCPWDFDRRVPGSRGWGDYKGKDRSKVDDRGRDILELFSNQILYNCQKPSPFFVFNYMGKSPKEKNPFFVSLVKKKTV